MLMTCAPAIVLHGSYMHTSFHVNMLRAMDRNCYSSFHMPRPFHVNMMLVMHRNCYAPCFSHAYAMSREHDASHAQELLLDMFFYMHTPCHVNIILVMQCYAQEMLG